MKIKIIDLSVSCQFRVSFLSVFCQFMCYNRITIAKVRTKVSEAEVPHHLSF